MVDGQHAVTRDRIPASAPAIEHRLVADPAAILAAGGRLEGVFLLGENEVGVVGGVVDFEVGEGLVACLEEVSEGEKGRGRRGKGEHLRSGSLLVVGAGGLGLEEEADEVGRWVGVGGRTVEVVNEDDWTLDAMGGGAGLLEAVEEED